MKPGDVFVGVVDFFSTLVPGAVLTFLIMGWLTPPAWWPGIRNGTPEGWALFLVSAYIVGHLVVAVASVVLDSFYDRFYARWRRASEAFIKKNSDKKDASWHEVTLRRIEHMWNKTNPDDELLAAAKAVKHRQLQAIGDFVGVRAGDISNTFFWAGTVVRARIPSGSAEIDALSGQSKLFRSLAVILPVAIIRVGLPNGWYIALWFSLFVIVCWRYLRLRWDATQRMYEYFLVATLFPTPGKANAGAE
jgi:hypothetical protein